MAPSLVIALAALVYLKPQELSPALSGVPLLPLTFVATLLAVLADVARGAVVPRLPPQAPWVIGFAVWSLVALVARDRTSLPHYVATVGIGACAALSLAIGMGTPRRVHALAVSVLALGLALAAVGAHQSTQPFACFSLDRDAPDTDAPVLDGRPCESFRDCEEASGDTEVDWMCERPGVLGTSSVAHGRVRYRGSLSDPNELALVIGTALPFAFALARGWTVPLAAVAALLAAFAVVETRSRGGQIVFALVVGLFFVRRHGVRGALLAAAAATPVLLLGGRSGGEADASARERLEAWYEGMTLFRDHPALGVGTGLFLEHHVLTAHNAYVLVAAETGFPGLVLWAAGLYASAKVPLTLARTRDPRLDTRVARLAPALLIAFAGMLVGIFLLSFAYHFVLYLFVGLSGALAGAARRSLPGFAVRVTPRELGAITALSAAFVVAMFAYTRAVVS